MERDDRYARNNRYGQAMTIEEVLARYVVPVTETGCHLWTGPCGQSGYGNLNLNKRRVLAHRAAWTSAFGPIPPGLYVCHKCDTPSCCNPDHMFLGTNIVNVADRVLKGRRSKLTLSDVDAIRGSSLGTAIVVRMYGVSASHVRKIRRGSIWKDQLRSSIESLQSQGANA